MGAETQSLLDKIEGPSLGYFWTLLGTQTDGGGIIFAHEQALNFWTQFMNFAYTKLLKIRGRLREFNFRKKSRAAPTYHVDCTDDRGNRFLFTMVRGDEGAWQLATPDLPAWIAEAEGLIATAIAEEEAPR